MGSTSVNKRYDRPHVGGAGDSIERYHKLLTENTELKAKVARLETGVDKDLRTITCAEFERTQMVVVPIIIGSMCKNGDDKCRFLLENVPRSKCIILNQLIPYTNGKNLKPVECPSLKGV